MVREDLVVQEVPYVRVIPIQVQVEEGPNSGVDPDWQQVQLQVGEQVHQQEQVEQEEQVEGG